MTPRDEMLARLAPALRQAWVREPEPPRVVAIFGCAGGRGASVHYLLDRGQADYEEIVVDAAAELGSLTPLAPAAAWHEREVHDRFGTVFAGHPDPRPLLVRAHPAAAVAAKGDAPGRPEFTPVAGDGIAEVAVGPVHAGIIEPGHFRFSTMGDRVIFLELRHFYTHKGTEDLLAGLEAADATPLVESVSGDNCLAHAVAYCEAVEQIAGLEPPPRAQALRLVGLELERLLAHVGDFGALCGDVGFAPMPALAGRLKEDLLRASARFCGTRYWRGIAVPGGVTLDPPAALRQELAHAVEAAEREFASLAELALRTPSVEMRFEGAGVLTPRAVRDWAVVGPVARASGASLDLRCARPRGAYRRHTFTPPILAAGDVMARARIRVLEASLSAQLILDTLADWPAGEVRYPVPAGLDGGGLAAVESPRGELLYWLLLRAGRILRCAIRSPSFQNWPALPSAVIGGIIADFPMINKSFNLSYSGCDR
jgi:formate hydrogenlyase subunit 5